jgi:hypothetical protein
MARMGILKHALIAFCFAGLILLLAPRVMGVGYPLNWSSHKLWLQAIAVLSVATICGAWIAGAGAAAENDSKCTNALGSKILVAAGVTCLY